MNRSPLPYQKRLDLAVFFIDYKVHKRITRKMLNNNPFKGLYENPENLLWQALQLKNLDELYYKTMD